MHPGTRPSPATGAGMNGSKIPTAAAVPSSLELRNTIYQTTAKSSRPIDAAEAAKLANGASAPVNANGTGLPSSNISHACDTCGADCTLVRYHSLKDKKLEICAPCYLDGRFPSTMYSGDFVKLTANAGVSTSDDWSDQEILLLLEGVEMYDDDWSKVEEHVGTRSAQQCIRKFLELPIEDPYLNTEGSMGPLRFGRIPFEQADNPVMSVVAFLAGVVGPSVAAEAAKTALHELTDGKTASVEGDKSQSRESRKAGEEDVKMDEGVNEDSSAGTIKLNEAAASPAEKNSAVAEVDSSALSHKPKHRLPHSKVARAADLALKSSAKAAQSLADAEDTQIRSALAQLIKLTLTKLELKMAQFEELEEILEDERKALESARLGLLNERVGVKKMLDAIRAELARNSVGPGIATVVQQQNAMGAMGTTGQGTVINEVQLQNLQGDGGPLSEGQTLQLG